MSITRSNILISMIALLAICTMPESANAQAVNCSNAISVNYTLSDITGTWYEALQAPAVPSNISCVQYNFYQEANNGSWMVNTTVFINQQPQTIAGTFSAASNQSQGFNLTYTPSQLSNNQLGFTPMNMTYKILALNSTSYAFVCGYAFDNSSSMGMVLTRQQQISSSQISNYQQQMSSNYTNLQNLNAVTQTGCGNAATSAAVPMLSALLAVFYALLKFSN